MVMIMMKMPLYGVLQSCVARDLDACITLSFILSFIHSFIALFFFIMILLMFFSAVSGSLARYSVVRSFVLVIF